MSGEETLAQVYREVESPKLKNFKRAALVVFLYSLLFTSLISFFAVMIIPDDVRMSRYSGNLIGGLAMNVVGPQWARLILNALVVVVGFLILSGAVNTAIVGSNGVLNRVSEDGVLPDWFLKPHPRFGTTSRLINLVVDPPDHHDRRQPGQRADPGRGLRLRRRLELRLHVDVDAGPPLQAARSTANTRCRSTSGSAGSTCRSGMTLIFLVLAVAAIANLLTKEVATITGVAFTAGLLRRLLAQRACAPPPPGRGRRAPRAPRAVQPAAGRAAQRRGAEPDQALPQAGGDPLAVQPGRCSSGAWPRPIPRRPTSW